MDYTIKKAENEKMILRIVQDVDTESPREWDNLGTMICWHSRYNLGDDHNYSDTRELLLDLIDTNTDKFKAIINEKIKEIEIIQNEDGEYEIEVNFNENPFWNSTYLSISEAETDIRETLQESDFGLELLEDWELMEVVREKVTILPLFLYDHSILSMSTSTYIGRAHHASWDSGQVGWIYCTEKRFTEQIGCNNRAEELLVGEVETYDQYLRGDVYGFVLEEKDDDGEVLDTIDSCWGFYGLDAIAEELKGHYLDKNDHDLLDFLEYVS